MWAVVYGNTNIINMLLNHDVNVLTKDMVGDTALMIASYHGNEEIVRKLLEKDGRVRIKDYNDGNALSNAKARGREDVGRLLSGKVRKAHSPLPILTKSRGGVGKDRQMRIWRLYGYS